MSGRRLRRAVEFGFALPDLCPECGGKRQTFVIGNGPKIGAWADDAPDDGQVSASRLLHKRRCPRGAQFKGRQ